MSDNNQLPENPYKEGSFEWHTVEAERKKGSPDFAFVWVHHPFLWDSVANRPYGWPEGQAHMYAAAFMLLGNGYNYVKVELCRDYWRKHNEELRAKHEMKQSPELTYDMIRQHR